MDYNKLKAEYGLLRAQEVTELLKIGKSTLYAWVAKGSFPKPVKLGERMSVWYAKDVINFVEGLRNENR